MSHCIRAYITKASSLKINNLRFAKLPQDFIIFTSHNMGNITEVADDVAIIQTDYFGGVGEQSARLWLKGKQVEVPEDDAPINFVLKELGVKREFADRDEFDNLYLSRYRSMSDIEEEEITLVG